MPVTTPVEVSPCAKPMILIFLPLPARRTSSASTGFPQGASTFTIFDDARVAISYITFDPWPPNNTIAVVRSGRRPSSLRSATGSELSGA